MTLEVEFHDHIRPDFLFELMEKQRLLPAFIAANPGLLVGLAERAKVSTVSDGEDMQLLFVEHMTMPNVTDIMVFILDRNIIRRKDELCGLQDTFRDHWFKDGVRRVQAYIPVSRKNTKRLLLYLGFVQETRDCGLRDLLQFGPKTESCIAMGLLLSDPKRVAIVKEEVGALDG